MKNPSGIPVGMNGVAVSSSECAIIYSRRICHTLFSVSGCEGSIGLIVPVVAEDVLENNHASEL